MKRIKLTQNKYALVNDSDYRYLGQFKWRYSSDGYAIRTVTIDGHNKVIMMHRLLKKAPKGMIVDHIDHNRLNNQRSNLRICTHTENMRNKSLGKDSQTGFKGVYYRTFHRKSGIVKQIYAKIQHNNEMILLGKFDTELQAAKAYNDKATELFGKYANLNQI